MRLFKQRPPEPIKYKEHIIPEQVIRTFDEKLLYFKYNVTKDCAEIIWKFKGMQQTITLNVEEINLFIDVAIAICNLEATSPTE